MDTLGLHLGIHTIRLYLAFVLSYSLSFSVTSSYYFSQTTSVLLLRRLRPTSIFKHLSILTLGRIQNIRLETNENFQIQVFILASIEFLN